MAWNARPEQTEPNGRLSQAEHGRAGEIRTLDLLDPNEALYQAEPQPEFIAFPMMPPAGRSVKKGGLLCAVAGYWQGVPVENAEANVPPRGEGLREKRGSSSPDLPRGTRQGRRQCGK